MPPPGRGMGMGGGGWAGMRSFRQDRSVLDHRIKKGTTRRMLRFAIPYRRILSIFLPVVVLDAVVGAVNPLILRAIIDKGILGHRQRARDRPGRPRRRPRPRRRRCSRSTHGASRRSSARASSSTCAPRCSATSSACRSPSSPGPRPARSSAGSTTTSSAPSRRSPTCSPTSSGNLITVVIVLVAMFFLSWQITLVALVLLPLLPHPGPARRAPARGHDPRELQPERRDEHGDERALQRVRGHARQALRAAGGRGRALRRQARPGCATSGSPRPSTPGSSWSR